MLSIRSILAGYVPTFCELSEAIAIIDALVALSVLASGSSSVYVRPQILDEGQSCRFNF